jgi:F-type H+-transporting ATPase subunit b
MKRIFGWGLIFVCALIFAILVDTGVKHLGVPDYIWLSVNLTLFLYLLDRYVGRPMGAFLEARSQGIAEELENARRQLQEADGLQADVSRRLSELEDEVAQIETRALSEGRAEASAIEEQTQQEETRFLLRVDEEITRREAEARARLAQDAADLTAQLARDLLEREMTEEDRHRVFERSLDAMRGLEGKEEA